MNRPIVFFDLETTGLDVANDRIVSIALRKYTSIGGFCELEFYTIVNPGIPIPAEATKVHSITNEEAAKWPTFRTIAPQLYRDIDGCDIGGYNVINFDIPFLWEEFFRNDFVLDVSSVNIIDPGNIFKKKEERVLSAAVKFYFGREMGGAHNAATDIRETVNVFEAQLKRYSDVGAMTPEQLAEFSRFDNRVDLAGKIVRNEKGEPVYNIGKAKGKRVVDDLGFGYWMLGKDFTQETKLAVQRLLEEARGV